MENKIRRQKMHSFWKFISFLADAGWFWILISLGLTTSKKTRKVGIASLISLTTGFLTTNLILKLIVSRERPFDKYPSLTSLVKKPKDYSFPSGHATASFAASLVYLKALPKKFGVPSVIIAAMVGFSRMYLGVHYLTDVLGGFLVALLSSKVACYTIKK